MKNQFADLKSARLTILVSLCLLLACGKPQAAPETRTSDDSLLITGVSIVQPSSNQLSEPRDILIVAGMITAVEESGTIAPQRASQVLQAEGLFALPGLIDVHAHIGDGGIGEQTDIDREMALAQFVRYGVTTIFVPGGGGGNDDQLIEWKRRQAAGEIVAPGLYGSGALITAPGSHPIGTIWDMPLDTDPEIVYQRGAIALSEDEAVDPLLEKKVAMKVDAIKVIIEDGPGPWFPKPRLSTAKVAELVSASHQRDLRVFAHVSSADHIRDGVEAGVDGVMHSAEDSIPDELLREMARLQVFFVPTLSLYDGFFDRALGNFDPEPYALAGVSRKAIASMEDEGWRSRSIDSAEWVEPTRKILSDNITRAAKFGVPIALGSDVNNPTVYPGYSAHEELELLVEMGLSPAAALTAATKSAASFLRQSTRLGELKDGFEADILILKNNPLQDILNTRAIDAVVSDGVLIENIVSTL